MRERPTVTEIVGVKLKKCYALLWIQRKWKVQF